MTSDDERGQDNTDQEPQHTPSNQQRQHTEPTDDERNQLFEQAFHDLQGVEELGGYPPEPVGPLTAASAIDPAIESQRVDEFPTSPTTAEMPTASSPARKRRNGGKGHGQTLTKRNDGDRNELSSSTSGLAEGQGTTRNSSSGAGPSTAKSAGNVDTPSKYTNKEQLALLRRFYLENPTPTKAQIIELANTTGRPWSKVKEYFRQRRNKLRGVDEAGLDGMEEPDRATSWLQMSYRPAPSATVSQLDIYLAYQSRFDPFHKASPLLGGQDLIRLACATFEGCSLARDDEGEWIMRGLGEKVEGTEADSDGHRSDGARSQLRKVSGVEEYLVGMPEPLRASTWLMHNYQPGQTSSSVNSVDSQVAQRSSVTQSDLYASYIARFGSDISAQADTSDSPRNALVLPSSAGEDLDNEPVYSRSGSAPGSEAQDIRTLDNRDEPNPHAAQKQRSALKQLPGHRASTRSIRLLNPLELINLTKMTFPGSEAIVDDKGRFVIKGVDRREGVGKYKVPVAGRTNDIFPFGLLNGMPSWSQLVPSTGANLPAAQLPADTVDPSSADHPFTSIIKRKLDVLQDQADLQPKAKRARESETASSDTPIQPVLEAQLPQTLVTAEELERLARTSQEQDSTYSEALPAADRELVEGLRRFKDSRLGREIRDVCVQQ